MLLYSKKVIRFLNDIKSLLKDVLSKEVGLKTYGDRFYDKWEKYSYPIKPVIFNHKKMLGYFDPHFYEIGFHECLMQTKQEFLLDIIRHELAHYITFINFGASVEAHGREFQEFCLRMRWSEEVRKATTCLDDHINMPVADENHILRKVQKLMALATSHNKHEAELAMIKSQQLLLKHNIDVKNIEDQEDEKIFLKRILKQKKENAKLRSIAKILETFFVNTIYNHKEGCIYLEVIGSATNVEIAEYVANTLELQLDLMWEQTKKQEPALKGIVAKNSFFLGVAQGYCNKIHFLKKQYDKNTSNALILIEKKLQDAKAMVYPRLSSRKSSARYCSKSSWLGEQAGSKLNINPAVNNVRNKAEIFITLKN